MDVLKVCPHLCPQNKERTLYDGFIHIGKEDFRLRIHLPNSDLGQVQMSCDWRLKQLLKHHSELIQMRLKTSPNLAAFLVELKSIAESQLEAKTVKKTYDVPPKYYQEMIDQIEELGWEKLTYVSPTFQDFYITATDKKDRNHVLKIHLSDQHPTTPPIFTADLPGLFEFHWKENSRLIDVYEYFLATLKIYDEFWSLMDEFDSNTWVLEPEKPNRSTTKRRIVLGSNSSLQIEVDPKNPRQLPECTFLGAEKVTNPLRDSLNKNLFKWETEKTPLQNLEVLLGIEFPSPKTTRKEDYNVCCGICYAYRLELEVPQEACNDKRCGQPFHQSCLYEWLRGLSSSRQSFNTVFGECPYCDKPITVKMPR